MLIFIICTENNWNYLNTKRLFKQYVRLLNYLNLYRLMFLDNKLPEINNAIQDKTSNLIMDKLYRIPSYQMGVFNLSGAFLYNNKKQFYSLDIFNNHGCLNTEEDFIKCQTNESVTMFYHDLQYLIYNNKTNDMIMVFDLNKKPVSIDNIQLNNDIVFGKIKNHSVNFDALFLSGEYEGSLIMSLLNPEHSYRLFAISYNKQLNQFFFIFIAQLNIEQNNVITSLNMLIKFTSNEFFESYGKFLYNPIYSLMELVIYNNARLSGLISWQEENYCFILSIYVQNANDPKTSYGLAIIRFNNNQLDRPGIIDHIIECVTL